MTRVPDRNDVPSRWQRVQAIFAAALDADPAERDAECAGERPAAAGGRVGARLACADRDGRSTRPGSSAACSGPGPYTYGYRTGERSLPLRGPRHTGRRRYGRGLPCAGRTPAPRHCPEATIALALGLGRRQAELHNTLGILEWERGRFFDALAHYESGLRLCREAGDRPHEGLMLNSMGVTLGRLHRDEEARTVLEERIALNQSTGERLLEAHALAALADVSVRLGRVETACECLERGAAIRRELGDGQAAAVILQQLASLRASSLGGGPQP